MGLPNLTSLNVATKYDICPLVTLLRDAAKPIPYADYPAMFERLGWVRNRETGGLSNFDINMPNASAIELNGEVARLRAFVSDTVNERSPLVREAVQRAFPEIRQNITDCIGFESTGTPLHYEGADWDLEDGSVIRLRVGENVLELIYMSKTTADNERFERQYGVDFDQLMSEKGEE